MLSQILDRIFIVLCSLALFSRLLLQPSLNSIESLGQEHCATLINNLILFIISFLFILKKNLFHENIRIPNIFWPLFLYCLLATVSIFYSIDAPSSLLYVFEPWSTLILMITLVNLLNSVNLIKLFSRILIILMAIACINAIYEYHFILPHFLAQNQQGFANLDRGMQELISSHRTPTIFGWPNIMAGFLVMTIPLTIFFFIESKNIFYKTILGSLLLLAFYTLYITLTISSWISLLVEITMIYLILKKKSITQNQKILGLIIIFSILLILVFSAIKKFNLPGANSTDARWQYLISSCSLIKLHPFLGSGFRSYAVANTAYIKDINGRSFFAHNSYLQIWVELGILGLLTFLFFLWKLCQSGLILIRNQKFNHRWYLAALLACIGGCMVDNLFSYTMLKPQIALFWWILCTFLISYKACVEPSDGIPRFQNSLKKFLLLLILSGGIMTGRILISEFDFFTAVHDIHQGIQFDQAIQLCLDGKKLNPWDKKFDLARAYALYSLYIQNHDNQTLLEARDAIQLTAGQVSLGFERDALLKRINDSLSLPLK